MELKPIKTKKIYEEIVEQIKSLVTQGQLKPGDRLPSERDLVEMLKVSRASIREALSALELMGLLEVRSGEGTYVRQPKADSMVAPLAWILSMESGTMLELLEVRKILEVQAVSLAAERATEQQLKVLTDAIQCMEDDLRKGNGGEKSDLKFHYAITQATNNSILIKTMDTISDLMHFMLKASRAKLYEGKYTPTLLLEEHKGIYESIMKRDPISARDKMLEHLIGVEKEIMKSV